MKPIIYALFLLCAITTQAMPLWVAAANRNSAAPVNFQSANAVGWSVDYASPPTFDPVGSPETFTITRNGYDTSANATTVTETITLTSRVRQVYPSHASLTASTVALSDYIYAGDTIAGVTNNSTRAYPQPIAFWLNRDLEVISSSTHTLRMVVAHAYARSGRPVAAVRYRISDGTNTAEILASTSVVSYTASGLSASCFEGTVDVSTLTQGATLTIDAVIYPWIGPAFTVSTDADTYPSPNISTLRALCNRTGALAPVYAYVSVGATGGTASTTAATAQADPYPTISAAAAAIKTLQGTNADRGIIRLETGTHVHGSSYRTTANTDSWPLTIEAANPANKATTIYQAATVTNTSSIPDRVVFRNITLQRGSVNDHVFLDQNAAANVYTTLLSFESCAFSLGGYDVYDGFVYRCARVLFTNCDGDNVGQANITGVINKTTSVIGCATGYANGNTSYNVVASKAGGISVVASSASRPAAVGTFWGWNFISAGASSSAIVSVGQVVGARGIAIVGNVIESWGTSSNATLNISGDNFNTDIQNAVMQLNSAVGERCNMFYLETATDYAKSGYVAFNVFDRQNVKSDVYCSQTVSGNWSARYKTGWRRNAVLRASSNDTVYSAASWLGDIAALGEVTGTTASPLTVNWVSDRSNYGTDAGGGDYTPGATNSLPTIPAGATPYGYDQLGRAIPTNGTAVVGAIQRP